jgi:plastocyanin
MRPSARQNTGFALRIHPRAAFPAGLSRPSRGYRIAAVLLACLLTVSAGVLAAVPGSVPAASVTITVHASDGRPVSGAVITVHSLAADARPSAPIKAVMDQINRAFDPDLLIVPVGSTVDFPNSDTVSHQIYSFSPAKRFTLPLYRGNQFPPVHFDQAGIVTLGCNIHDEMVGYLVVTDAQYFGRTDASGSWTADIARGKYRVSVWHPRMNDDANELERELTVAAGDRVTHELRLTKPLRPAPLSPHPHSWDGY